MIDPIISPRTRVSPGESQGGARARGREGRGGGSGGGGAQREGIQLLLLVLRVHHCGGEACQGLDAPTCQPRTQPQVN
jgi:hypothetical protein